MGVLRTHKSGVDVGGGGWYTLSLPGHMSLDDAAAAATPLAAPFGAEGALGPGLSGQMCTRRLRKQAEQFAEGASMPT